MQQYCSMLEVLYDEKLFVTCKWHQEIKVIIIFIYSPNSKKTPIDNITALLNYYGAPAGLPTYKYQIKSLVSTRMLNECLTVYHTFPSSMYSLLDRFTTAHQHKIYPVITYYLRVYNFINIHFSNKICI